MDVDKDSMGCVPHTDVFRGRGLLHVCRSAVYRAYIKRGKSKKLIGRVVLDNYAEEGVMGIMIYENELKDGCLDSPDNEVLLMTGIVANRGFNDFRNDYLLCTFTPLNTVSRNLLFVEIDPSEHRMIIDDVRHILDGILD
jgi:hypothetical protein